MSFSNIELLKHILDEINFITGKGKFLNEESFLKDETLKRAIVRSFENNWRGNKKFECRI
jgi:hypothetical protein